MLESSNTLTAKALLDVCNILNMSNELKTYFSNFIDSKDYENLKKAFEELREVEEKGCCNVSNEYEIKKALKGAKEIAVEAMEGITDGTLRGEKAEELLKRFGEQSSLFCTGVGNEHGYYKCKNAVCQQRIKFMTSLTYLLRKMARITEADAFKPIQADRWTLKGDASKVSKPFEIIPADSFGLDVNPDVKSKKEAQKEQLSKLTAENEELKLRLKEESDTREALYNIMEKTKDDTEPFEKENNDLKEKSKAFEKENNDLKAKVAELEKKNKDLEESLALKEEELDFLIKDYFSTFGKEWEDKNATLKKNIEEKDAIIVQKDADLEKRKADLLKKDEEITRLKLQNPINEPEEEQTDGKKNDEKKKGDGKKSEKQPKNPKIIIKYAYQYIYLIIKNFLLILAFFS